MPRFFRLAKAAEELGLSCDATGLKLAGAPLLRQGSDGAYSPRAPEEVQALLACAYGEAGAKLSRSGLDTVARALNQGDLAKAMTAALFLRLPPIDEDGARRIANADQALAKYDPGQARDPNGRWTSDGGSASSADAPASSRRGAPTIIPAHLPTAPEARNAPTPADASPIPPTNSPRDHVPTGYQVTGGRKAEVDHLVKAMVVAKQNLDPGSQDYKNLDTALRLLDQNKVMVNVTHIPPKPPGETEDTAPTAQMRPGGILDIDMNRIDRVAQKLVGWNPASNPDDVAAAYGASVVAHELRHEADMLKLWNGAPPPNARADLGTEINAYTTQTAVYRGLNLNYPPVYTKSMSADEVQSWIERQAQASVSHAYGR
jgi:hypothetical protein